MNHRIDHRVGHDSTVVKAQQRTKETGFPARPGPELKDLLRMTSLILILTPDIERKTDLVLEIERVDIF